MRTGNLLFSLTFLVGISVTGNAQVKPESSPSATKPAPGTPAKQGAAFKEGADYEVFNRVRIVDKVGFTAPQEAYSLLLPKGWNQQSDIVWNMPGTPCSGTFKWLKASSSDSRYELLMYPDLVYVWNTNQEIMRYSQGFAKSSNCAYQQPVDAENYLRQIFMPELGQPQLIKIQPNQEVVNQMQQSGNAALAELRQYGAADVRFYPTALNAVVQWSDGTEGLVVLGTMVTEITVMNAYTGSYDKSYTTSISSRTVFRYPGKESESAKNKFALIMSSIRTNPYWNDAVNKFWKDMRQQSHVVHLGTIRAMDEQTKRMGEQAIKAGEARLQSMDLDIRNWEKQQSSQDRINTSFIKTIREVEHYRDETGVYEMSSSYSNAWSRGDGNSFVMSNNPNFDPASLFQDQRWKEMKKVN